MDDEKDMDVLLRSQSAQVVDDLVLQIELLVALGLLTEHELKVVDANALDIICIYGMLK